ncbi:MAG: class C sortase [Oscillospiraceae bacterium]|nr:class C sortase [Oscillospiraceae bacterium]
MIVLRWLKKHIVTLILLAVLLVGLGFLSYPTLADYWNSFHQSRAIMAYSESVANMDREEYDRILSSAKAYNEAITQNGLHWTLTDDELAAYTRELNFNDDGNMGFITIEKINVMLPIYHGTSEAVLQTSIGHIESTSLPVGGEGSHCVLSGHRGLPSARLFTDLDKLVEGDTFTLNILSETFTYQVDQIRVVEPSDLSNLQLVPGKDYCTLVTCTPYGINTHRLLVRGHRVENKQGDAQVVADAMQIETIYVVPFVGVPILTVLLLFVLITTRRRKVPAELREMEELELDAPGLEEFVQDESGGKQRRKRTKKR